jgi:hypothetical protein
MMSMPQGQIYLDPAELTLLAKACDCLASELEDQPNATLMLNVSTLGVALRAQALANAYEFYLSEEHKAKAEAWANLLKKGIQL